MCVPCVSQRKETTQQSREKLRNRDSVEGEQDRGGRKTKGWNDSTGEVNGQAWRKGL